MPCHLRAEYGRIVRKIRIKERVCKISHEMRCDAVADPTCSAAGWASGVTRYLRLAACNGVDVDCSILLMFNPWSSAEQLCAH